jgi:hypothetical protein
MRSRCSAGRRPEHPASSSAFGTARSREGDRGPLCGLAGGVVGRRRVGGGGRAPRGGGQLEIGSLRGGRRRGRRETAFMEGRRLPHFSAPSASRPRWAHAARNVRYPGRLGILGTDRWRMCKRRAFRYSPVSRGIARSVLHEKAPRPACPREGPLKPRGRCVHCAARSRRWSDCRAPSA